MEKQTIHFVTGNSGKFASLKAHTDAAGIIAIQTELPLIEPQADTIYEISRSKAEQAFAILRKPLIVNDAGMHINALNGFPGPYIKYVLETLGIEKVRDLVAPLQERRCRFVSVLTYMDEADMKTFESTTEGQLAREIDRNPQPLYLWSDMERLFIPEHADKPLSAFTEEDYKSWLEERKPLSGFAQLVAWLTEKRVRESPPLPV